MKKWSYDILEELQSLSHGETVIKIFCECDIDDLADGEPYFELHGLIMPDGQVKLISSEVDKRKATP